MQIDKKIIDKFKNCSGYSLYNPTVGKINDKITTAWIKIKDKKESLMMQADSGDSNQIYKDKYILSPLIYANQILFSAEGTNGDWPLYSAKFNDTGDASVKQLSQIKGRIRSVRGSHNTEKGQYWICYECRIGKKTEIYAAYTDDNSSSWIKDIPVTDGSINTYDPHIAIGGNNFVYVVYTAFIYGNYHIMLQKLNNSGERIGEPVRISNQLGANYWPSITTREEGGVWICWCSFTHFRRFEDTYLQHYKYKARRRLFMFYPAVHVGVYKNDQLYTPLFDPDAGSYIEACLVENSVGAKYPDIIEKEGEIYLLYRKYNGENKMQSRSDYVISILKKSGWSEPEVILKDGLHEGYIDSYVNNSDLQIAYAQDNRNTGWNINGEWFDEKNSIDIGRLEVKIEGKKESAVTLYPGVINPVPIPGIQEKDYELLERSDNTNLVWGQTHSHTDHSICQRMTDQNMDFNYRFYQDVQKSDFGTTTDHAYNMWDLEQHLNHKMADYYYFPGEFIAFPGYEWTGSQAEHEGGPFGHVNPICLEENQPMSFYTPVDKTSNGSSLNKLWQEYQGHKIITIPHHTANKAHYYNWKYYKEKFVPIVEIFQDCRGQQEQREVLGSTVYRDKDEDDSWVLTALKKGYKLGFIGGGDHSGTARGAVVVKEKTRTGLYQAIKERRTYASTGGGADIKFTCNENPVGSVVECKQAEFILQMNTNEYIKLVEIVKNGETVNTIYKKTKSIQHEWDVKSDVKEEFWYCRILLENGEIFWTSPIWIKKTQH